MTTFVIQFKHPANMEVISVEDNMPLNFLLTSGGHLVNWEGKANPYLHIGQYIIPTSEILWIREERK